MHGAVSSRPPLRTEYRTLRPQGGVSSRKPGPSSSSWNYVVPPLLGETLPFGWLTPSFLPLHLFHPKPRPFRSSQRHTTATQTYQDVHCPDSCNVVVLLQTPPFVYVSTSPPRARESTLRKSRHDVSLPRSGLGDLSARRSCLRKVSGERVRTHVTDRTHPTRSHRRFHCDSKVVSGACLVRYLPTTRMLPPRLHSSVITQVKSGRTPSPQHSVCQLWH